MRVGIFAFALLATAVLADPALAYIGPGAGLSAIGTLVAVVGVVLLAIVGFVWYPVKRFLNARKKGSADLAEKAGPDGS